MSTLSESKEVHVAEDVLRRLSDPSLLHTESYIGGSWVNAADDERVDVRLWLHLGRGDSNGGQEDICECQSSIPLCMQVQNPATGEVIARVTHSKAVETKAAIAEASAVFGSWSSKTGRERSVIIRRYGDRAGLILCMFVSYSEKLSGGSCRWFEQLRDNKDDIATLMALESGKPLAQAKAEIASGYAWLAGSLREECP